MPCGMALGHGWSPVRVGNDAFSEGAAPCRADGPRAGARLAACDRQVPVRTLAPVQAPSRFVELWEPYGPGHAPPARGALLPADARHRAAHRRASQRPRAPARCAGQRRLPHLGQGSPPHSPQQRLVARARWQPARHHSHRMAEPVARVPFARACRFQGPTVSVGKLAAPALVRLPVHAPFR